MRWSVIGALVTSAIVTCAGSAHVSATRAAEDTRTAEIPGTGLAVTLPADWRIWSQPSSGISSVIATDVGTRLSCGFELVDAPSAEAAGDDAVRSLDRHRHIEVLDHATVSVRAGDAVRVSYRMTSLADDPRFELHEYYVTGPRGVARVSCQGVDPSADRWLSVVDALSVAGVQGAASAPFDPRVEVPEHGVALDFGAEWLVRDWAGPGALLGSVPDDGAGHPGPSTAVLRAVTIRDGKMDAECFVEDDTGYPGLPGADALAEWQEVLVASSATRGREASVPEVTEVDLGPKPVVRADWTRWRGMPATAWVFIDGERRVVLFCRADDPPADRWRSIAESFERRPEEESLGPTDP